MRVRSFAAALCLVACLCALAACRRAAEPTVLQGRSMGTTWSVRLYLPDGHEPDGRDRAEIEPAELGLVQLEAGIVAALDEVVAQMSTWREDSDISRYNAAPAGSERTLPEGFFGVLDTARALAADTGGAFDPTVGPLVDVWGFGPAGPRTQPPDAASVEAARARVGWQRLVLDPARRVALQPGGVKLDLSAIAKGFAVDRVASHLDEAGVRAYLVEIGGELRARGAHPDGSPWRVAIERAEANDRDDAGAQAGDGARVLALHDAAMATSGDYRHAYQDRGRRYSHEIDPRSGAPADNGIAAVTVVHADCMHADALATALFVLGPDEGWQYALDRGLAALFVTHDGDTLRERMTPAFAALATAP